MSQEWDEDEYYGGYRDPGKYSTQKNVLWGQFLREAHATLKASGRPYTLKDAAQAASVKYRAAGHGPSKAKSTVATGCKGVKMESCNKPCTWRKSSVVAKEGPRKGITRKAHCTLPVKNLGTRKAVPNSL